MRCGPSPGQVPVARLLVRERVQRAAAHLEQRRRREGVEVAHAHRDGELRAALDGDEDALTDRAVGRPRAEGRW